MSDQVDICNMALAYCKAKSIININEHDYCLLFYETARKFLLENNPWKFAGVVEALQLHTVEPQQWVYSYAYPSNCLKIRRLLPNVFINSGNGNNVLYRNEYFNIPSNLVNDYKVPYETALNDDDGQAIWTNEPEAYISYTTDQTDTSKFSNSFVLAFSYYLASLIAIPITGRKEGRIIVGDTLNLYMATLTTAVSNNQIEKYSGPLRESDMTKVYEQV